MHHRVDRFLVFMVRVEVDTCVFGPSIKVSDFW